MTKKNAIKAGNWGLVFICFILIILGGSLSVIAALSSASFGLWSLLLGFSGLTTVAAGTLSIIKNNPTFILLDLILPK